MLIDWRDLVSSIILTFLIIENDQIWKLETGNNPKRASLQRGAKRRRKEEEGGGRRRKGREGGREGGGEKRRERIFPPLASNFHLEIQCSFRYPE